MHGSAPVGRGAGSNPPNRFEKVVLEQDLSHLDAESATRSRPKIATELIPDEAASIVSTNDSPDLYFRHSVNPYRGCAHGCSYCYARTYHEFLGYSAGIDFESKILFKPRAADLFRDFLNRRGWTGAPVMLSGATDCYQGCESELQLTRQILEVAARARQPVSIVTKNALVARDLDLLKSMAKEDLVHVSISITSLDEPLLRRMEPRSSSAAARLRTISELVDGGIPTRALIAPIVPGLTDFELPALVNAVAEAGAMDARYTVLRLPGAVKQIFLDWLDRERPDDAARVRERIRQLRGGELHDQRFHHRMRGSGATADHLDRTFEVFRRRAKFPGLPELSSEAFVAPRDRGQRLLF